MSSRSNLSNGYEITFNQAWKDFLLMPQFNERMEITITRIDLKTNMTTTHKVVDVKTNYQPFKQILKNGEQFIVDEFSYPNVLLAFPKKIVDDAINVNVSEKIIGKVFSKEQFEALNSKLDWENKKRQSRLGCVTVDEIQQTLLFCFLYISL